MNDGLPQSTVNDIIQTQDGYIWLATFGGLVRFDGYSFKTFNRSNTEGMNYDRAVTIFEDSNKNIWVGTEQGVVKLNNGEAISFDLNKTSSSEIAGSFKEDKEGRIWVSLDGIPYLYLNKEFVKQEIFVSPETQLRKVLNDRSGIWLFTEKKVLKTYQDTLFQILDLNDKIESLIMDFVEYPERSGNFFIGTGGDGVIRYKDGELVFLNEKDGIQNNDVFGFYVDKQSRLWVNSYGGISRWDGSEFESFPILEMDKNVGMQIHSMLEDNEGNIWLGSIAEGLYQLTASNISMIDAGDGLSIQRMLSLTTLNDGTYLFGTNCGGIYTYKNKKAELAFINRFLPNLCIWSVFQDSKNRIWFSSDGLYRTNSLEEEGISIGIEHGFDGENIFAFNEDSNGNIWIGCSNGIFKYNESGFTTYRNGEGLNYPETRTFFEDSKGTIWAGTISGVYRISDEKVEHVKLSGTDEPYIRAIHEDGDGVLWFGSYGNGLFRMEEGEVLNITSEDGLFDDIVSHIVEDEFENFWVGSNRGIFRVAKKELNEFSKGEIEEVFSYSYGTGDGMNSSETNGGFYPNTILDQDDNIYFPTVSGVAVVSTKAIEPRHAAPQVYIESVRSAEEDFSLTETITLPHDNSFLEITYTALSFSDPEKMKFRYRLEGLDDSWVEVDNRRSALYTKIPPGKYTFHVIAVNNNGSWNTEGSTLEIIVVPPFWQRYWFYGLVFTGFIGLTGAGFYYRLSILRKENERQRKFSEQLIESQENERKRIANELHDGLGQQILVIKNRVEIAKQAIGKGTSIDKQLDEIQHSASLSIEDVRNISHNLRPVILEKFGLTDAVLNLCEQVEESTTLDWSYHVDQIDGIFASNKEITFYRVLQEGINNILKHAKATQASLIVQYTNDRILVTLYDDGIGFDPNIREANSSGLGLMGMKERVEILRGNIKIQSNSESGTTLKIQIPIKAHAG